MSGTVRLTRRGVAPLLKTVPGRPRVATPSPLDGSNSSDVEGSPVSVVDEDDSDGPDLASIKPTVFVKGSRERNGATGRGNARGRGLGANAAKPQRGANGRANSRATRRESSETPPSAKKRKLNAGQGSPIDEDDGIDMFGGLQSSGATRRKVQQYGSKAATRNIHAPQERSYGKKNAKKALSGSSGPATESDAVLKPELPTFKAPPEILTETSHNRTTFQAPKATRTQTRLGTANKGFVVPPDVTSSSASSTKFAAFKDPSSSNASPRPAVDGSSPVSAPPPSSPPQLLDSFNTREDTPEAVSATIECPMCKTTVPRSLYDAFRNGHRLNIRQQRRFCRSHNRATAMDQWTSLKYPQIDWEALPARFPRHHPRLANVLNRKTSSHYRDELDLRLQDGKSRNALRNVAETHASHARSPGYYGLRGARVMLEYVTEAFKGELRACRGKDMAIAYSLSGYSQGVLVPELAMCLIMEDMSVGEEEARRLLWDSAELGDLVHDDDGEEDELSDREGREPLSQGEEEADDIDELNVLPT